MIFFVIPHFKNVRFLEETLRSLIAQTEPDWRALLLVNSADIKERDLAKECLRLLGEPRISVQVNEVSLPMAENWNFGLGLAKNHELTVLLHSDDRLLPDYVKEMQKFATQHPEATAYFCKSEIINEEGKPVFSMADWYKTKLIPNGDTIRLKGYDGIRELIPGNYVFCPTLCYRMKNLNGLQFRTDLKMVVDFDLILRILLQGGQMLGFYEKPLFLYRRHQNNLTTELSKNLIRFHEEVDLYQSLAKELESVGQTKIAKRAKRMEIVKLQLGFRMLLSLASFHGAQFILELKLFVSLFRESR